MQIFPAIDLKDGQAVRLEKGLMNSAKIYSNEPYKLVQEFQNLGANFIHLVDLNGAIEGKPVNENSIKQIREHCQVKLQLGGGIRNEDTIKRYLDLGIDRVILGSIAQKDPSFVCKMAEKYPIVVGIDAKDGKVAVEGWESVSEILATTLAKEFADAGIQAIICTDIGRDGMLSGVNVDFTLDIARASGIETIASGGVKDIKDIKKLKATNEVGGVIVGKAYYEGRLDLEEAFAL